MTTVIFDVGNVLLHWDPRRIYRDELGNDADIDAFFEEIGFHHWNLEQDRGRTWAEGVAHLSARFPHHADRIARADRDWHRAVAGPIEPSVQVLRTLAQAGNPVYGITNFSAEKWAECREHYDFLHLFKDVVVSAHERIVKPKPEIYRLLLDRNGLIAADCVFIDDSAANISGAAAVGLKVLHFQSPETLVDDLRAHGVAL